MLRNLKGFVSFLPGSNLSIYHYSPPFLQNYYYPFYSPSSSSLPRLILLFLFKKLVKTSISPNWIGSYFPKGKRENPPKHPSPPFKEKEKEVEGRSKAWWPMEGGRKGFWLGGQWKEEEKVFGLVANGKRKRRFFSTSSTFPPSNFT